jgi:DNA-binding winged helix-turn-helix (wHTH) protein
MSQARFGADRASVRFGEFEMDPNRGVLSFRGSVIKLQPQPFSVLQILLANAPNLVTREQLGDAVWGSDVFVDLDQSLNYCVRQIRLALGDNAGNPRFVETLPKQGYRFIFPISREEATLQAEASESTVLDNPEDEVVAEALPPAAEFGLAGIDSNLDTEQKRFSRRTFAWLAGGALAIAGGSVWISQRINRRKRPGAMHVVLPLPEDTAAADPGRLLGPPVISPDGSAVVVALFKGTQFQLYIRRLDNTQFAPLEGTEEARQPFWSPDSQHIGFFAKGKLSRMPAVGGTPVALCDASSSRGGSWGSEGQIIFGINGNAIFAVAESGGQARAVTHLDGAAQENSHRYPLFLPDGNRFLYFARADDLEKRAIWLEALDGRQPRRRILVCDGQFTLGKDPDAMSYSLLSQQGGKIVAQLFDVDRAELVGTSRILLNRASVFCISDTGVLVLRTSQEEISQLVWSDRSGKRGGTVGPQTDYWGVAIAPNNLFIVANRHDSSNGHFRLWLSTLATGLDELFSQSDHVSNPIWSPDSNRIYYGDSRQFSFLCRTVSPRSEETVLLSRRAHPVFITSLSADRRFAVGELPASAAQSEVGWMELQLDQKSAGSWHPIGGEGTFSLLPRLSPDGKWIAYPSNQSGTLELYLVDFPHGLQHRRISLNGGSMPRWRGDSKELFFLAADGHLMAITVTDQSKGDDPVPVKLFYGNLRLGSFETLYDVTSDGQRFILIERVNQPDDSYLEMVLNWPSLLSA